MLDCIHKVFSVHLKKVIVLNSLSFLTVAIKITLMSR